MFNNNHLWSKICTMLTNNNLKVGLLGEVGKAIKGYRVDKGVGQGDLAKAMGTYQYQISRFENGEPMDIYTALKWQKLSHGELPVEILAPWYKEYLMDMRRGGWYDKKVLNNSISAALQPYKNLVGELKRYRTTVEARIRLLTLLRFYRNYKALSQIEISEFFKVSQSYYSLLETGGIDLDFERAIELMELSNTELTLRDMCYDLFDGRK